MLDLTSLKKPTMAVRLSEELTVDLLPASKGMIDGLRQTKNSLESVYGLAAQILSENKQHMTYAAEDVAHLDIFEVKALVSAYLDFIRGLRADPN